MNTLQKLILKYPEHPPGCNDKWKWRNISRNPCITPEFIEANPDLPWDWKSICENPNLTLEFIAKHENDFQSTPDLDGYFWSKLSKNVKLTDQFLDREKFVYDEDYTWNWDWSYLSENPTVTSEMIDKYSDEGWDWRELSRNPNVTPELLEKYHDKAWDWIYLSAHPNISLEFIEKHIDFPWYLGRNQNLTFEFIEKHIDKIGERIKWGVIEKYEIEENCIVNNTFGNGMLISYDD